MYDKMDLSQRIALYYFVFGLIGVIGLSCGIAYASHKYLSNRSESMGLAMVGQAVPQVLIKCIQGKEAEREKLLRDLHREHRLIYASIVDAQGKIALHTDETKIGKTAKSYYGRVKKWGEIDAHRFVSSAKIPVCEFRAPLISGDRDFGTLRLAALEPSMWGMLAEFYEYLLLALLIPVVVFGFGIFVLRKSIKPIAGIESQLRRIAHDSAQVESNLSEITMPGTVSVGWNKVIQRIQNGANLTEEKIHDKVASYRNNQVFDILDSLPDGLAVADHKHKIKLVNKSFENMFATDDADSAIIGKNIFDLVYEPNQLNCESEGDRKSNHSNTVEEVVRTDGDEERILRVARFKLRDNRNDKSQQQIWTVRDITQFKLTEKMRDEFLDSATHELRTPLSNIKAYAETLAISEVLDIEQQKEFCNTINSEATRLARFIDDLLSISNVEAGSLAISRENVEVDRMMRDVVTKVKPLMAQKDIEFNAKLPEKRLPALYIDKDKVQVALVNLLGNAAKYTNEHGRVDVNVKLSDDQIYFSVEDTGIGITEEELPKLFDKFYRSEDERVQEVTGTGLGLSLAKEIVQLHGGKISVESEPGKGSKFTVILPARTGVLA